MEAGETGGVNYYSMEFLSGIFYYGDINRQGARMAQLHKKSTEAINLQNKGKKKGLISLYKKGYGKHPETLADVRAKEKAEFETLSQEDWS
jgi:hypothetical protein